MVLPLAFMTPRQLPVGLVLYWVTTNLWTVGQGLITRRLMPRPVARAPLLAHPAEGSRARGAPEPAPAPAQPAEPRSQAQEEERGGDRDQSLQVEATGETVGEAKWAALRELEKLRPGIDKAAVRFQVVSEGERGLLGVGYAPARVIATVEAAAALEEPEPAPADESELAAEVREVIERILDGDRRPRAHRDHRGRRDRHRDRRRPRARARDRQARADDRRDPVPRQRHRLARPRRRAQGGRGGRRRLPRAPRGDAEALASAAPSGRSPRPARSSSSR